MLQNYFKFSYYDDWLKSKHSRSPSSNLYENFSKIVKKSKDNLLTNTCKITNYKGVA